MPTLIVGTPIGVLATSLRQLSPSPSGTIFVEIHGRRDMTKMLCSAEAMRRRRIGVSRRVPITRRNSESRWGRVRCCERLCSKHRTLSAASPFTQRGAST